MTPSETAALPAEALRDCDAILGGLILRTPTGDGRNALCDVSIMVQQARPIATAFVQVVAALELIEVDLTAGDMPAKTRVALALDRVKAALALLAAPRE